MTSDSMKPLDEPAAFDRSQADVSKATAAHANFDPSNIERPDPRLLRYYVFVSLLSGPLFPVVFLPLLFKYQTLKYQFDESGVSMSWGILFRREIHLTFRRIQDIHLNRNLVQRWMGLASLGIQTASGSATPEMTIEGILEAETLRDYLYAQMRGARGETEAIVDEEVSSTGQANVEDITLLLTEIRDAMQVLTAASPSAASPATATIAGHQPTDQSDTHSSPDAASSAEPAQPKAPQDGPGGES